MEGDKLEWTLRFETSILDPSLRPEVFSIFTPNVRHPPHGVGQVSDSVSLLHLKAIR